MLGIVKGGRILFNSEKQVFFEGKKLPLFGFGPKPPVMIKRRECSVDYILDDNTSDFDSIKHKEKPVLLGRGW